MLSGVFAVIVSIGIVFYQALVFMLMFNWFVGFNFSVELIDYWVSLGLILMFNVLRPRTTHKSLMHYERKNISMAERHAGDWGAITGTIIALSFTLLIGWIISSFM